MYKMTTKSVNRLSTMLNEVLASSSLNKNDISTVMEAWNDRKGEVTKLFDSSLSRSSKRKKDPNAPKKWKTGYILFCIDQREKLKNEDQNLSATEITSRLGAMWKAISEKDKAKYEALSKKDKARYEADMTKYTPSGEFSSEKSGHSKKERTGPKRPLSSYMYYCQDNREVVKTQNPNMNGKEITTELGRRWQSLSDQDKVPYETKASADKVRFTNEKSSESEQPTAAPRTSKVTTQAAAAVTPAPPKSTEKSSSKASSKPSGKSSTKAAPVPSKQSEKSSSKSSKKSPGFDLFCEEQMEDVQNEHPDWNSRKVQTELTKMWQDLTSDDREAYEMEAGEGNAETDEE